MLNFCLCSVGKKVKDQRRTAIQYLILKSLVFKRLSLEKQFFKTPAA